MVSDFRFRPRAEIDRSAWDAFVDASEEAWLWHRSEFIDARSIWRGCSDASFGVLDARGSLVAVMPLYLVETRYATFFPLKWLFSEGGAALIAGRGLASRRKLLRTLETYLPQLMQDSDAEYIEARSSSLAPFLHGAAAPRINPLVHLGFENTSTATWMIDLAPSPDEIRRRYSETTRQELKKAELVPYTVRQATGARDLEIYYELHLETIERLQSLPEPFEFFQKIFDQMIPRDLARIVFFERGGQVVAANNVAVYKRGAYYWTGISRNERGGHENRVLFDHQVMWSRNAGCVRFEAGKAYIAGDNPSLVRGSSDFKRSFGSEMVTWHGGRIRSIQRKFQVMHAVGALARVLRPRRQQCAISGGFQNIRIGKRD